ncbi:MAG: GIY-YIG nuclease family protein [Fibrobacteres bacterium]|nr:GIY-YIG nuclease family protein [Fibrobacterota bacterium]
MTTHTPRTIQIFLPDGNPRSVRIAEITSRTVKVVQVPRAHLEAACARQELANVGVYFLVGETESGLPQVYVGEAEECAIRLRQHNKAKDWWTGALVCISKTQDFTKAHVKYLEWFAHQEILASGRFRIENGSIPTKSHVSESVVADLMDHFDTLRILVSTLGYPFFDRIQPVSVADRLVCKGKKAQAFGEYIDDGFVVFAGGIANREFAASIDGYLIPIRNGLLEAGILEVADSETYRFTRDHIFPSPSQAAAIVLARTANGWTEWKYPDGRTLDEVKRKA